jgi:small subunit ribosomal protein S16
VAVGCRPDSRVREICAAFARDGGLAVASRARNGSLPRGRVSVRVFAGTVRVRMGSRAVSRASRCEPDVYRPRAPAYNSPLLQIRRNISMVTIRLARGGAKKRPYYHVVVADSRKPRDGRFIERLGFFNPIAVEGEERVRLDTDRIAHWQSQGASTSAAVTRLLKSAPATSAA